MLTVTHFQEVVRVA